MDKKTTSWVAYVTFIGWLVAYLAGDKEGAKFHLNQSLIVWLGLICVSAGSWMLLPMLGIFTIKIANILQIFLFICWIIGLINAINQEEKELPLIGQIKILQ